MIKTVALVLKKQNIGETDRILTIFSPHFGKRRVIVRAVRKPLSKLAGHLDTFMVSRLMLTDEPDLPKVTSADLTESFEPIRTSLELSNRAFAVSRIIERVILEDVSQPATFRLTVDTLTRIIERRNWSATWLYFLSRLTTELGLGVDRFTCNHCNTALNEGGIWDFDDRLLFCPNCSPTSTNTFTLSAEAIKLFRLLKQQPFSFLERVVIPEKVGHRLEELFLREITQWLNRPWESYASLMK